MSKHKNFDKDEVPKWDGTKSEWLQFIRKLNPFPWLVLSERTRPRAPSRALSRSSPRSPMAKAAIVRPCGVIVVLTS